MNSVHRGRTLAPALGSEPIPYLVPPSGETLQGVLPVSTYFRALRRNWLAILAVVAVTTGLAALLSYVVKPVYKATARLSVDEAVPSAVVGPQTVQTEASELDQAINTDIQLIQSDAVLRPVAERFHLNDSSSAASTEMPVLLRNLSVSHVANSRLIDITFKSTDPIQAAGVANAVAHAFIAHEQEMRVASSHELSHFMETQIVELKKNMENSAQALAAYQRQLGVINPDQKTSILTSRLLQLNTQLADAQNERIRKETEFKAIQTGSMAALEVSPQAAALNALEERKHTAEEIFALARTVYGPTYPEYKRASNALAEVTRQDNELRQQIGKRIDIEFKEAQRREAMLRASLDQTKDESDKLSSTSFQYEQLKREADANTTLYNELYRKVKESTINAGFENSSKRIADEARPPRFPFFPNRRLFIFLGLMFSLICSTATIVLGEILGDKLLDAEAARDATGLPVLGTLPAVRILPCLDTTAALEETALVTKQSQGDIVLLDFYRECISSALSSIMYAERNQRLRSIILTSPGSGEGKSSCTAYLSAEHALQGKRTLVIDADLRRPSQHDIFGLSNSGGLARMIEEEASLRTVRQRVPGFEKLDVVVAGNAAKSSYGKVGQRVAELIRECAGDYDLILVDAPPMLNLAEPIQIARGVDGVILVSQAGLTRRNAVLDSLSTLRGVHANVLGLLLNRVTANSGDAYSRFRAYTRYSRRSAAV